jgi:hypothetical protein
MASWRVALGAPASWRPGFRAECFEQRLREASKEILVDGVYFDVVFVIVGNSLRI